MGEYAMHNGQSIKIGSCESMYYLRADQAHSVTPKSGSVDPIAQAEQIRFRFPFPDEDHVAPGFFDDHDRRQVVRGVKAPAELAGDHYSIQFTSSHGYLASMRCPESIADAPSGLGAIKVAEGVHVHRNGFKGATFLCQQRLMGGQLLPILRCACGMAWRVGTLEDAAPLLDALAHEHDRYVGSFVNADEAPAESHYSRMADRVRQGFDRDYVASLGFSA